MFHGGMPRRQEYPPHYDPAIDKSPFMAALDDVRRMCTRAELTRDRATAPGSYMMIDCIRRAIDDFAERETGSREYFWGRPHSAG
jgi:hypothetical protein